MLLGATVPTITVTAQTLRGMTETAAQTFRGMTETPAWQNAPSGNTLPLLASLRFALCIDKGGFLLAHYSALSEPPAANHALEIRRSSIC